MPLLARRCKSPKVAASTACSPQFQPKLTPKSVDHSVSVSVSWAVFKTGGSGKSNGKAHINVAPCPLMLVAQILP